MSLLHLLLFINVQVSLFRLYANQKSSTATAKSKAMIPTPKRTIISETSPIKRMLLCAATVGVGTALFYDPLVCQEINKGIAEYLDTHNYKNVAELVGSMHMSPEELDEAASG